ncbi:MAG: amidohydrolase family protein [Bacteroidales bacterium]|nr:amidohydrolase family protein [Bacteroidales bacterium]
MIKISADYIFPITSNPIKNGILIFETDGKIIDVLKPSEINTKDDIKKYKGILCPGFINTHSHIELSYLKNLIKKNTGLGEFVIEVQKSKKKFDKKFMLEAIKKAEEDMVLSGTVAVGDVSNTNLSFSMKEKSKLNFYTFLEIYGSNPNVAKERFKKNLDLYSQISILEKNNKASIVPHAPYSVSEILFKKIKEFSIQNNSLLSFHHQESNDENLFFKNKTGKIVENFKKLGISLSHFKATGLSPLQSIASFLPKQNKLLLVHNTFSKPEDIDFAIENFKHIYWCFCPNANLFIENRLPNIPEFINKNAKITIGTDSYASNETLSVLEEIKTISNKYSEIHLEELLKWSTINGAEFLGFDEKLGSFEKGKNPGINLIEDFDLTNMRIVKESKIKVIKSQNIGI